MSVLDVMSDDESARFARAVERLNVASERAANAPSTATIEWPEHLVDAWCFSEEWMAAYGTDVWETLDDVTRRRLSFFEAVNFFSLNIQGERVLMDGLIERLNAPPSPTVASYLEHFLDEERDHSAMFDDFCRRYAAGPYPDRKVALGGGSGPDLSEPGRELLFFGQVLMFESIVDVYDKQLADDYRLAPVVRAINRLHHRDEARHLKFGRLLVPVLLDGVREAKQPGELDWIREQFALFLRASWRDFTNPTMFRDAGLEAPWDIVEQTWDAPAQQSRRVAVTADACTLFFELDLLDEGVGA